MQFIFEHKNSNLLYHAKDVAHAINGAKNILRNAANLFKAHSLELEPYTITITNCEGKRLYKVSYRKDQSINVIGVKENFHRLDPSKFPAELLKEAFA